MRRDLATIGGCLGLLASACVGTSDEVSTGAESTGGNATLSASASMTAADGSDSGPLLEGCAENLLDDPGFEAGTPSTAWDAESDLFGTPICTVDCTDDVGAGPFVGDWWVWFGGIAMADNPSIQQTLTIPDGNAMLRFGFSINASSGTGNDVFTVIVDEDPLLRVTDAEVTAYSGWRLVEIDVSSYADGGEHTLSFSAAIAGVGVTNFFVDEVELLPCDDAEGSSGGTSMTSGTSTTSGTSSSSSAVDTES